MMEYALASLLIFAVLFNLFMNRDDRFEVEGFRRVRENFEKFAESGGYVPLSALKAAFNYLDMAGFDRLFVLREEISSETGAKPRGGGAEGETAFVFVNKNYSVYLDLICEDGVLKKAELMSQFSDSKIFISGSDERMAGFVARWVEYCVVAAAPGVFGPDGEPERLVDYLHGAIASHVEKIKSAHAGALAPYYATARNYASCRNYARDIIGIERKYGA